MLESRSLSFFPPGDPSFSFFPPYYKVEGVQAFFHRSFFSLLLLYGVVPPRIPSPPLPPSFSLLFLVRQGKSKGQAFPFFFLQKFFFFSPPPPPCGFWVENRNVTLPRGVGPFPSSFPLFLFFSSSFFLLFLLWPEGGRRTQRARFSFFPSPPPPFGKCFSPPSFFLPLLPPPSLAPTLGPEPAPRPLRATPELLSPFSSFFSPFFFFFSCSLKRRMEEGKGRRSLPLFPQPPPLFFLCHVEFERRERDSSGRRVSFLLFPLDPFFFSSPFFLCPRGGTENQSTYSLLSFFPLPSFSPLFPFLSFPPPPPLPMRLRTVKKKSDK